jgi:membrane-associated phospholipid phosphatase
VVAYKDFCYPPFTCRSTRKLLGTFVVIELPFSLRPVPVLADVRVLPPKGLNTSAYLDLNHFSRETAWAHGFMHAYALWLGPVLLALVFVATYAVAWWQRASRPAALLVLGGIGTIVTLGLNQIVSHAAEELRPYVTHPQALVLVPKAHDYSFPSDHSVIAGGLTASLLLIVGATVWQRRPALEGDRTRSVITERRANRSVRALAGVNIVLGLFLCFARVYVGVHYPGDVVAGYLLASLVVVVLSLLRPLAYRALELVEPTLLGALFRRPGPTFSGGKTGPGASASFGSAE